MGKKGRAGRKRKGGERFPGGKLRQIFDRGADHAQRLRDRFARFQGGKAGQQVCDPIGRAWAVGLLENDQADPAALRDAGRDYAARYWGYYPAAAGVANYEQESRRGSGRGLAEDPMGERFRALDALARGAGRNAYEAVQSLCLDFYWFPDDNPAWLERLINLALLKAKQPVAGALPTEADHARMKGAVEGLLAIVGTSAGAARLKGGAKAA